MCLSGEAVAALKALGYVYGVNQVILGATVLAWGNSLADAVSDPAMAAAGYPAMGLAAAIASPLFTLLGGTPEGHGTQSARVLRSLLSCVC